MNLFKMAFSIASLNIGNMVLTFLTSIFIVRMLGVDIYGKYIYIIAVISSLPIWYVSFDQVLIRFGSVESVKNKITYLKSIIVSKLLVFTVVVSFMILYLYNFEKPFIEQDVFFYVISVVLMRQFMALFQTTFATIVNIYEKYLLLTFTTFAKTVVYALFICYLYFFDYTSEEALYLICTFTLIGSLVTLVLTIRYALNLLEEKPNFLEFDKKDLMIIFEKDKLKYFGPLQLVSIQSYLKQYLPQLLLGNLSSFSNVAYYEILRKIYHIVHKFIPKIMELFFPNLIKRKKKDKVEFFKFLKNYAMSYFVIVFIISVTIFSLTKFILAIFDLTYDKEVLLLTFLFSLNLVILSISYLYNIVERTSNSTKYIFIGTTVNSIFGSIITYFLINNFQILGAVSGVLIGSFILAVFNIIGTYKYFKNYHIVFLYLTCSILFLTLIYELIK